MNKIISFSGRMGSGKDTYANMLQQQYPEYQKFSFAGALKEEVFQIMKRLFMDKADVKTVANEFDATVRQIENILLCADEGFDIEVFCAHPYPKDYLLERRPFTRWLLQYWGTDVRRASDKAYWLNKARETLSGDTPYVITDARFTNELQLLHDLGAELILLDITEDESRRRIQKRDQIEVSKEALNHPSEIEFLSFKDWTYVQGNGTIDECFAQISTHLHA